MNVYDKDYYAHYAGNIPYDRQQTGWLRFFDSVAQLLVDQLHPRSVMDLGCAKGFLVEALRDRGVEAFGVDVSEYAISEVRPDIRSYCRVGSITVPLDRQYDLITCIEVLEHLTGRDVELALDNLCGHARQVLFSSSPTELYDGTHLNVRPREYWVSKFAERGFYLDPDFDARILSPQAMLFRSLAAPPKRFTVAHYSPQNPATATPILRVVGPLAHLAAQRTASLLPGCYWTGERWETVLDPLAEADLVVIQADFLLRGERREDVLREARRRGVPVLLDLDELLFDLPPEHPRHRDWADKQAELAELIRAADAVTVPTLPLQAALAELHDKVIVLPNYLDDNVWAFPDNSAPPQADTLTIGFAGRPGHEADLDALRDALLMTENEYGSRVRFRFLGCAPKWIAELGDLASQSGFVDDYRWQYPAALRASRIDIGLAPLRQTSFNRAKSHIRYLEYAAAGITGIYADLPPYQGSVRHGETGLLAGPGAEDWFRAIRILVENEGLRAAMARNARQDVAGNWLMSRNCAKWLKTYTQIAEGRLDSTPAAVAEDPPHAAAGRPGASVIVVAYNSQRTLATCLDSLLRNTGDQDELIVVDNASGDATPQLLEDFAGRHPGRIRIIRSAQNLGFSRGTNLGLAAATKDHVVLLNPDVQVTAGWLERMTAHLTADDRVGAVGPTADYVAGLQKVELYLKAGDYSDADAVSAALAERNRGQGRETKLLIGFCLMTRRDLLQRLGNLDPDLFLGNDDLDLSWRLRQEGYRLVVATDVFVRHYGQVSFATAPKSKTDYLVRQSTNALFEKLYRRFRGKVPSGEELWDIPWFQPQTDLVSIVVLAHNNLEVTAQCLESVYQHTSRDFELILVDNGSTEDVASYAAALQAAHGNVTYLRNEENQGYAYGCNQGLAVARGEYVVLLNNDVLVTPGWLSKQLALLALDERIGLVGPRTNYSAGLQQVDGVPYKDREGMVKFADEWFVTHAGEFTPVPRITGVCMVMKRAVLKKVGGFDTQFGVGNFEDDDLCLRVFRAGYVAAIANDVFVHHYGSTTFRTTKVDYNRLLAENWRLFCHKWEHAGEMKDGYPAVQLAEARPFDPLRDSVPLRYEEVFHPKAQPLTVEGLRPVSFLCLPDWDNPAWREVVERYCEAFTSADPVSLVVRVEPPSPESAERAFEALQGLFRTLGLAEDALPDVVVETTAIPPSRRGGLYTGMTALLTCPGSREAIYVREARACGLPVVQEVSVAGLRRLAAERRLEPA